MILVFQPSVTWTYDMGVKSPSLLKNPMQETSKNCHEDMPIPSLSLYIYIYACVHVCAGIKKHSNRSAKSTHVKIMAS